MSYAFPLALGTFWQKIRFAGRPEFVLTSYKQQSQDGAENIISSKLGQPKWRADIVTAAGRHGDDMAVQAMVKVLIGRNGSFNAYDIRRPYPLLDPLGTRISGYTPQIRSIGTDNRSLSVNGLRTQYGLSPGDKMSVSDDDGHQCLLEVMEPVDTGTDAHTTEFEVQPFLPTWLAVGNAVDLIKPPCRFKIVAGSYKPQSGSGNLSDGFGFSMISVP